MLYGIRGCTDPATAYISSITYWIFSCRDRNTTPAKGLDKWTYLGSAIQQAATTASDLEQYQANLADRLKAKAPILSRYSKMLIHEENQRVILFAEKTDTGITNIREVSGGQALPMFVGPAEVLQDLLSTGIHEADVLALAKPTRLGGKAFVIQAYCQVADQIFGWQPLAEDEPTIEVDAA